MNTFEKSIRRLVKFMYHISGASIMVMTLLTCADIFLRFCTTVYAAFGWEILSSLSPIPGTYELVCLLGVVAAGFAMAHTSLMGSHVSVDILVRLFSLKIKSAFEIGTSILGFCFFAIVGWRSIIYAEQAKSMGDVSMTLRLPYYPFIYVVSFGAFTVCLVTAIRVANELKKAYEK